MIGQTNILGQAQTVRGAVIVTRVSTGKQVKQGTSLESQLELCRWDELHARPRAGVQPGGGGHAWLEPTLRVIPTNPVYRGAAHETENIVRYGHCRLS